MDQTYEYMQHRDTKQDRIIHKSQQAKRNTAEQAVSEYKAELGAALKSIVEDAQLPEARTDPEIANALLWDMLDVLRYKGVIQA